MQIHELPGYSGEPSTADVFPIDTGTHTFKLSFSDLGAAIITAATATISGTVQTVKAAIEALATRVTSQENKTSTAFRRLSYTVNNITVAANTIYYIRADDIGHTVPSGYVAIGFEQIQTNSNCAISMLSARATGDSTLVAVKNTNSSSVTISTMYITLICARSNMFSS